MNYAIKLLEEERRKLQEQCEIWKKWLKEINEAIEKLKA
jgi:hypothetical protein